MGKCLRPRVHSEAGPQKCWSDHRPPTAGTRPLPAHWALAGLDITSPGLHVKAPVWPKRLLSVLSENRAPRWGAAVGSAEGGLGVCEPSQAGRGQPKLSGACCGVSVTE